MKFLAFQLQAFGFNESTLPEGWCLFRQTILKGGLHHVQWQIELELWPRLETLNRGFREGDIVSVQRPRGRRPDHTVGKFAFPIWAWDRDYAVLPSLIPPAAAAAAEVKCHQRVKRNGALIKLAHHDLRRGAHLPPSSSLCSIREMSLRPPPNCSWISKTDVTGN